MDAFLSALNMFFTTFKAAVFVPVFIFVIALAMGVKPKKAFFSALSAGVGLEGFSLVIGSYSPILSPIIDNMINAVGINLPIVDLGWQTTSIIAYSYQVGMIYIAVAIALQVIAKRWSNYYGYPNCTIASLHTATVGIFAVPLNLLLDKLSLYKVNADPTVLRKKLGFIGEPMTLGLFLGLFIGIVGDFNKLGELATWGEITTCGIATAAVMAVFPKVSGIFAGSFSPITEAGKKKMKAAGHADREWYLAVNDATGYGEAATLITGILLMPTTLVVSFILPGNLVLPMLDLVAIPYIIQPFIACSNGNILKSFIGGLIFMIANLYFCTLTGPAFTDVAISTGIDLQGATMVTSLVILGQPVGAIIFLAFLTQNPIIIGAVVVVYVICYVLVHKNMTAIHEFIENSALNHTTKKVETAA